MMCNKTDDILTELELKLVQTAAKFLGNMLNYAS